MQMMIRYDIEKLINILRTAEDNKPLPSFQMTVLAMLLRLDQGGHSSVWLSFEEYLELEPYIYD